MQNFEVYVERSLCKVRDANKIYGSMIFRPIAEVENVEGFETIEHYRSLPNEKFHPMKAGDVWGGNYMNLWLHATLTIPEEAKGQKVYVTVDAGSYETLCFVNGRPVGMLNSKNDFVIGKHYAIFICDQARPGDTYDVAFECYANHFYHDTGPYASYGVDQDTSSHKHTFQAIRILVLDEIIKDFYFDFYLVHQMAHNLPKDNFQQKLAHECIDKVFPKLILYPADGYDMEEIHRTLQEARKDLAPALAQVAPNSSRGYIGLVGHSHMDTAWLWPLSETIRKCARTYAEALALMREYPDYHFVQSSSLHSDWMRRYYPDIFEEMKQRVAEGRYEPNGGVWVECDCNIPSGESIIRQFVYGNKFNKEYFNYRADSFWLPDTFGYNAQLPQIMKKCGISNFFTSKIDWNDLNHFPLDTFIWRGSDGSEVLTHLFINHVMPDVDQMLDGIARIDEKRSNEAKLVAFGYGDGGGGPTYGMCELAKRLEGSVNGLPTVHQDTVSNFIKAVKKLDPDLPVYDSELYLEYHRGTLTTMSQTKRNNRKAEIALHNMEALNVISGEKRLADTEELLKVLLTNQFHDIVPGTGIEEVNVQSRKEMAELIEKTEKHVSKLNQVIAKKDENFVTLRNLSPVPFDASTVVTLPGEVSFEGANSQTYVDVCGRTMTDSFGINVPSYGAVIMKKASPLKEASPFKASGNHLTTPFYEVEFDADGYISSLVDLRNQREIRRPGGAPLGTFFFGENLPVNYDNWEIEWDECKKQLPLVGALLQREIVSVGACEYRIRSTYQLSAKSTFKVDTVFYAKNPRIDYHLLVDWNERHRLFKVGFDVTVKTPFVRNEIQFGHVLRPTTRNDSIEFAKYEVCNQKWSDLSDPNYGVALLNDCKYGIGIEGSDMRLTLHRGGIRPDPTGDRGVHEMSYSLLPHIGNFTSENVIVPAYQFNMPLLSCEGTSDKLQPFCALNTHGVLLETIKGAEEAENGYVLRLYECEGGYNKCKLNFAEKPSEVQETNMLEEYEKALPLSPDGSLDLSFTPFEIKTILVKKS